MNRVEYKVVKLRMKGLGILTKDVSPDLESTLNSEGRDGWRLVNTITPTGGFGESEKLVLVFMREVDLGTELGGYRVMGGQASKA